MVKYCGIYCITNLINKNIYLGSTNNFEKRKKQHLRDLRANRHHNIHLQRAYNLYGKNSFKFEILEQCKEEDLLTLEQKYLDKYFDNGKNCYNINCIADKPPILKGKDNPNYGKSLPKSVVEKIQNTKKLNGINCKGKNNPNYGKIGILNSSSKKFISLYNLKIYNGFRDYSRITGLTRTLPQNHCLKKNKKNPILYMYLDEYNNLTIEEQNKLIEKAKLFILNKKIIDLQTLKIFDSVKEYSQKNNIPESSVYAIVNSKNINKKCMKYGNYLKEKGNLYV